MKLDPTSTMFLREPAAASVKRRMIRTENAHGLIPSASPAAITRGMVRSDAAIPPGLNGNPGE